MQLQAAALKAGQSPSLKCGPYELMKVIHDALKALKAKTLEEDLVMKAALRNGILAWRPCQKTKKLVKVDEETQPWCKGLPKVGDSHRLKREWSENRWEWLNSEGVPLEPNWSECTPAKTLEEQADLDQVQSFAELKPIGEELE